MENEDKSRLCEMGFLWKEYIVAELEDAIEDAITIKHCDADELFYQFKENDHFIDCFCKILFTAELVLQSTTSKRFR